MSASRVIMTRPLFSLFGLVHVTPLRPFCAPEELVLSPCASQAAAVHWGDGTTPLNLPSDLLFKIYNMDRCDNVYV